MEIICSNCHQVWRVSSRQFLAARLKFVFGADEHTFICPNCHTENVISKEQFKTSDSQIPVTGNYSQIKEHFGHPPGAANDGASAPTNPITAPEPSSSPPHGVVLKRGLSLQMDHKPDAEIVGRLWKGEQVNILDTWTDGETTWIQIGPERWAVTERDGNTLIQLTDG